MIAYRKLDGRLLALAGLIFLLAFQDSLNSRWGSPFNYIDECVALIGAALIGYEILFVQKLRLTKRQLWLAIPLTLFVLVNLAGNVIYRYQPLKVVLTDMYTNLKFFFAIATGYYLFRHVEWKDKKKTALYCGRIIAGFLFVVFLADRFMNLYPFELRYGINCAVLFYSHPTYLAGVMAFLLVLFTVFYEKKNIPFILMALIMMAFTLRSKAIVSAAMYVAMFVYFIVLKWKLKIRYVFLAGIAVVAIAWPQISYYFIGLEGISARSIFLLTSLSVLIDYFPIGTGFGTFGSAEAIKNYSPVYYEYGLNYYWETRNIADVDFSLQRILTDDSLIAAYQSDPAVLYQEVFSSDHFWPIILGQSGFIGTILFLFVLVILLKHCLDLEKYDLYAYVGILYVFVYLMVTSMAEAAFHNSVSIPLAVMFGIALRMKKSNVLKSEAI